MARHTATEVATILALSDAGRSQRDIAEMVGGSVGTINHVIRTHRAGVERTTHTADGKRRRHVVAPLPEQMHRDRHTLYRLYADGELLYIGRTATPMYRLKNHAVEKDWWPTVGRATFEHFETAEALDAAEREAIRLESPIHNVVRYAGADR